MYMYTGAHKKQHFQIAACLFEEFSSTNLLFGWLDHLTPDPFHVLAALTSTS